LHSAAESRMYADIGGKPCLTEETGVLGPMTAGEREKAAFARTALFSNWVHDCKGMLWWCGFDQLNLDFSPYNYSAVEQELGLFREDRTPKPVLVEFRNFSNFLEKLPLKTLPPRKTEALCILTEGQDNWAVAYSTFILAKQAGFDIQFQKSEQVLRNARVYLLPSVKGLDAIFKDSWYKILDRVKDGATLYLSLDFVYMPTLTSLLGIEIKSNIQRRGTLKFNSRLGNDSLDFETFAERRLNIDPLKCTVLGKEADGNPAFIMSQYGKGKIYMLTFPIESNLATTTGAFDKGMPPWCNIYKQVGKEVIEERILMQNNPYVGVTEHSISDNEKVVVLINYNYDDASSDFKVKNGWKISDCLYGKIPSGKSIAINANDAVVLMVKK